jgi:hypothetical protein
VDALNGEIQFLLERFFVRGGLGFRLPLLGDVLRPGEDIGSPFVLCRLLSHGPTLPSFGARNKE